MRQEVIMSAKKTFALFSSLLLGTAAVPAYGQTASSTNEMVRAQYIKSSDVSPEEYQRLLDEAAKVSAYQQASTVNSGAPVYQLPPQAYQTAPATPYRANSSQNYTYQASSPSLVAASSNGQPVAAQYPQQPPSYSAQNRVYDGTPNAGRQYVQEPLVNRQNVPMYQSPASYGSAAQPMRPTYASNIAGQHNVSKGDTLYNISKRYGVKLNDLKAVNGLSNNTISIGQALAIPGQGAQQIPSSYAAPRSMSPYSPPPAQRAYTAPAQSMAPVGAQSSNHVPASSMTAPAIYAVLPGDTINSIASRACVSPAQVVATNGLAAQGEVYPGQRLALPSGHCLQ